MPATAHIIGAGLAGLASALTAQAAGYGIALYEATGHLGGRCRSFVDSALGCTLDNGTHLVLGCNRAVFEYLRRMNATDRLRCIGTAFPMYDLATETRFEMGFGWPRIPGVGSTDVLWALWHLLRSDPTATVGQLKKQNERLFLLLWQPLCEAILNTEPDAASLALLRRTLWEILKTGRKGTTAWLPVRALSETFVDPAETLLRQRGGALHLGMRLKALEGDNRITALAFPAATVRVGPADCVILAVPPTALAGVAGAPPLSPALQTVSAIANIHYLAPNLPATAAFCGLSGGLAHWVFPKGDVLSVTISAANAPTVPDLAERVWGEVLRAFRLPPLPLPPHRIITEKRATPQQSPTFTDARPIAKDLSRANLWQVGDWTDTGLPCTIESALYSGLRLRLPHV